MNVQTWMIAALALSSCAEARPDDATHQRELATSAPAGAPQSNDQAAANELERAAKAASADGSPHGPTAEAIDWEEAGRFKQLDAALLPASEREKVGAVKLPVLAFDDESLLPTARLSHNTNWYVVAVNSTDGLNMNIHGTRNAWTVPNMEIPEAARAAAENYTLTRTHAVVTVSFRAFGASYSVDIECAKPLDDTRCTQDEFALAVVEHLGVIGGQP